MAGDQDGTAQMVQRTVLLTGAAGSVGQFLLPGLSEYALRLTDLPERESELSHLAGEALSTEVRTGDLADRAFTEGLVKDVDTVVHLAGNPAAPSSWAQLRVPNIEVVETVLDAAQAAGVRRVILASSVHAMGAYVQREQHPVDPAWPPSPCCVYGATKAFAEAIGRTYTYRTGLSVVCLRFGGVQKRPVAVGSLPSWIAPEDLRQLVVAAIEADTARVAFGVYHGISANTRREWDTSNAQADLGYEPTRDSEIFLGEIDPDTTRGLCPPGPLA
ncbi:NAD(P)-dependent oxidoreductase [Actinopolymorpha pittospori]